MKDLHRIEPLFFLAKPPHSPIYSGSTKDWKIIEDVLEMRLPNEYQLLINEYGTGNFLEFLFPLSPFAPFRTSLSLLSGETKRILFAYAEGRKQFPEYSPPFPAYPEATGLFPWAVTINGDTVFWLTRGNPDRWPVVVCDSKFSEDYDYVELTTVDFLCSWLRGEFKSKVFPSAIQISSPIFRTMNLTRQL